MTKQLKKSVLKATIFLSMLLSTNLFAQAWSPNNSTGYTEHKGYVYSGTNSINGKFLVKGNGWTSSGLQMHLRGSSTAYSRIIVASDGMLFRNYDENSYKPKFSFRAPNGNTLFNIYKNGKVNIGYTSYSTPAPSTGTLLRVMDNEFPSIMVSKGTSSNADFSLATGNGFYSNISKANDAVLRASSGNLVLTSRTNSGSIKFATGFTSNPETQKMILTQAGNLGIGVSNPTKKLEVNGTIRTKEVIVESTGWSDFVFEKDYNLPELKAVEKYINDNGHLPSIPSAKQVEEEGINVGSMQSKLLQKIEELTLYIIKQDKKINELEKKLN